jgi:hypothetical protein
LSEFLTSQREEVRPTEVWRRQKAEHEARADDLVALRKKRAALGESDPVEDFLYTYYPFRFSALRRWTPGVGVALMDAEELCQDAHFVLGQDGRVRVISPPESQRRRLFFARDLCRAVAQRPAFLGCFGLHEWAMVYAEASQRRHARWPLRLGAEGTDAVVRSLPLRCTHYDAFRFFTASAKPLNRGTPDLAGRLMNEQPGCVHVTMDLYKWTMKSLPWVPSDLAADTLALAYEARTIDMRASPYDFSVLGLKPICIETVEGRAEYEQAQRLLAQKAEPLRARLIATLDLVLN